VKICIAEVDFDTMVFSPNGVITMVSSLATKVHKTLHGIETDETMVCKTLSTVIHVGLD